jgi:hypothetical protein
MLLFHPAELIAVAEEFPIPFWKVLALILPPNLGKVPHGFADVKAARVRKDN